MPDLDDLLRSTTPRTVQHPDLEALHRRGSRRRRVLRAGSGSALVAVAAVVAVGVQQLGPPAAPSIDAAAPGTGDDGGGAADSDAAETTPDVDDPADAWFGVTDEDVAAAAALLPDVGTAPEAGDFEAVRGTDLGRDPHLRSQQVTCYIEVVDGDDPVAGPFVGVDGSGGRTEDAWQATEATAADLVAECGTSDQATDGYPTGTLCASTTAPSTRDEVFDSLETDGYRWYPGDAERGPVTEVAAVPGARDCASTRVVHGDDLTLTDLDSLELFNDRRRVDVALRAAERGCLDARGIVALAIAASDRLGGDWRVATSIDPTSARTRPCTGLWLQANIGTITVDGGAYWDRDTPSTARWSSEDARLDDELAATLRDAVDDGDVATVGEVVDRVADGFVRQGRDDLIGALRSAPDAEVGADVLAASDVGCLTPSSAVTLASVLHEVATERDPDGGWLVGEHVVDDLTRHVDGAPEPACFQVDVLPDENGETGEGGQPAVTVVPVWID